MVFDRAHGVKAKSGAALLEKTDPCLIFTAIMATITAKKRFENTQKAALGNIPVGAPGVGSNGVVMINSCMYPHVKYEAWRPQKQNKNFTACAKNSGLLRIIPSRHVPVVKVCPASSEPGGTVVSIKSGFICLHGLRKWHYIRNALSIHLTIIQN